MAKQQFLDVASNIYTSPDKRKKELKEQYKAYSERVLPIQRYGTYLDIPISMVMRSRPYKLTQEQFNQIQEKVLANPNVPITDLLTPDELKAVRSVPGALSTLRRIRQAVPEQRQQLLEPIRQRISEGGGIFYQYQKKLYETKIPGLGISEAVPAALLYGSLRGLSSALRWRRTLRDLAYAKELGAVGYGSRALGMISSASRLFHTIPTSLAMLAGFQPPTFSLTGAAMRGLGHLTGASQLGHALTLKGGLAGALAGGMLPYLPYMALSMGLSIAKARKLSKLQPKKISGAEIEQKTSASAQVDAYLTTIYDQIQPPDYIKIQLLKLIESHTSPISEIYSEVELLRQQREKGTSLAEKDLGERFDIKIINPLERAFNTFEKKLLILGTKYNPFQQLFDILGGKTPEKVIETIKEAYHIPSLKEEAKEARLLGISITSARLLKVTSSQLIASAPTYEGKMLLLTAGLFDLMSMQVKEMITMRKYGTGTTAKSIGYEEQFKTFWQKVTEFFKEGNFIEKIVHKIPVVSALYNLVTLPKTLKETVVSFSQSVKDFFKGPSKEEIVKQAREKIITTKTTQEKAFDYMSEGLPAILASIQKIELDKLFVIREIYSLLSSVLGGKTEIKESQALIWDPLTNKYVTAKEYDKQREQLAQKIEQEASSIFSKQISTRVLKLLSKLPYFKIQEPTYQREIKELSFSSFEKSSDKIIKTIFNQQQLTKKQLTETENVFDKLIRVIETGTDKIISTLTSIADRIIAAISGTNIPSPESSKIIKLYKEVEEQKQRAVIPKAVGQDFTPFVFDIYQPKFAIKSPYFKKEERKQENKLTEKLSTSKIISFRKKESQSGIDKLASDLTLLAQVSEKERDTIIKLSEFVKEQQERVNLHRSITGELTELKQKQLQKEQKEYREKVEFSLSTISEGIRKLISIDKEQLKKMGTLFKEKTKSIVSDILGMIFEHPIISSMVIGGTLLFPKIARLFKEGINIGKWVTNFDTIDQLFGTISKFFVKSKDYISTISKGVFGFVKGLKNLTTSFTKNFFPEIPKIIDYFENIFGPIKYMYKTLKQTVQDFSKIEVMDLSKVFDPIKKITNVIKDFIGGIKSFASGSKTLGKIGSTLSKVAGPLLKTSGKIAGKTLKYIFKKLGPLAPIIGFTLGAQRWAKGQHLAAIAEIASGIFAVIPGLGTLASLALDTLLWLYDKFGSKDELPEPNTEASGVSEGTTNVQKIKAAQQAKQELQKVPGGKAISKALGFDEIAKQTEQELLSKLSDEEFATRYYARLIYNQLKEQGKEPVTSEEKAELIKRAFEIQRREQQQDYENWARIVQEEKEAYIKYIHDHKVNVHPLIKLGEEEKILDDGVRIIKQRLDELDPDNKHLVFETWLKASPILPFSEGFAKLRSKLESLKPQRIPLTFSVDEQSKKKMDEVKTRVERVVRETTKIDFSKYKEKIGKVYDEINTAREKAREIETTPVQQAPTVIPIPTQIPQPIPQDMPTVIEEKAKEAKVELDPLLESLIEKIFPNVINSFQHETLKYPYGANLLVI